MGKKKEIIAEALSHQPPLKEREIVYQTNSARMLETNGVVDDIRALVAELVRQSKKATLYQCSYNGGKGKGYVNLTSGLEKIIGNDLLRRIAEGKKLAKILKKTHHRTLLEPEELDSSTETSEKIMKAIRAKFSESGFHESLEIALAIPEQKKENALHLAVKRSKSAGVGTPVKASGRASFDEIKQTYAGREILVRFKTEQPAHQIIESSGMQELIDNCDQKFDQPPSAA